MQPSPATLHMIVPLVGLRVSFASESVLRIARASPTAAKGFVVIKSSYTGPTERGPVIEQQSLAEGRKEELMLEAPDAVAARQWLVVLTNAVIDAGGTEPPAAALPPRRLLSRAGTLTAGGGSSGIESPRGRTLPSPPPPLPLPPRIDSRWRRSCQLYLPFEPEVPLVKVEAVAHAILQTQGLLSSAPPAAFGGGAVQR